MTLKELRDKIDTLIEKHGENTRVARATTESRYIGIKGIHHTFEHIYRSQCLNPHAWASYDPETHRSMIIID